MHLESCYVDERDFLGAPGDLYGLGYRTLSQSAGLVASQPVT